MKAAQSLLARAWRHDARGWWAMTTAALAATILIVVGVAGLLEGMNRETEDRIADFYTGDLRLTQGRPAAAPAGFIDLENSSIQAAIAGVEASGGTLEPRVEAALILGRRSLIEAYLLEDDSITVDVPGGATNGQQFAFGVLVGLQPGGRSMQDVARYLVAGGLPEPGNASSVIEVLVSEATLRSMLAPGEEDRFASWPPTRQEMAPIRFELTAGRIDDSGPVRDLLSLRARVVGLFDSGIDTLDRVTVVTTLADGQALLSLTRGGGDVNVLVAYGGGQAAQREAEAAGLRSEDAAHFTQRYLGQMVDVVRALTLGISLLLLALPTFLLWYGLSQQLERNQRELTICRAIGVPRSLLVFAVVRLAAGVVLTAGAVVVVLVLLCLQVLPGWLADSHAMPLPLGFVVPLWVVGLAAGGVAAGSVLAVAGTVRRHIRRDIASTLRSP